MNGISNWMLTSLFGKQIYIYLCTQPDKGMKADVCPPLGDNIQWYFMVMIVSVNLWACKPCSHTFHFQGNEQNVLGHKKFVLLSCR
jgi:hypothetical protein